MALEVQANKMSNLIIFDFEVFRHDTLLGAIVLSGDEPSIFQSWDLDEIRQFYRDNINSIWIGHNNTRYDNFILQAIVQGGDEEFIKKVNDRLIATENKGRLNIQLNYFDLMSTHIYALKTIEAFMGKNISETQVDFNLPRKLTQEEKELTESYNLDDLEQTLDDFYELQSDFTLRLDIMKEFNLPMCTLHETGTQVAERVLHAERIDGIEEWYVKPEIYPTLRVKNQAVLDFYLGENFRRDKDDPKRNLSVILCGTPHKLGAGGIHGALNRYSTDWAYYFDVSGYYNLVMILYDLLPRTIPDEYKELYKYMYHEQLRLKKIDPVKRWVYKTILLSVFGSTMNEYTKFYDPQRGSLITMTGQMFLVDLLEKLEGKVTLIQSNTDGVIAKPLPGVTEKELVDIINEWQARTGFVLKLEKIYNIHQRDVNCYCYQTESGEIHTLGEAVLHYDKLTRPFERAPYNAKEPLIIAHGIVEYFMFGQLPEQTVEKYKRTLRLFQYICKKRTYDYVEYETTDLKTNVTTSTRMQHVNRAFALKSDDYSGMVYKYKMTNGKLSRAKISNLPESVFVYNNEILSEEAVNSLIPQIDYNYYIKRIYERILEFNPIPLIKTVNI